MSTENIYKFDEERYEFVQMDKTVHLSPKLVTLSVVGLVFLFAIGVFLLDAIIQSPEESSLQAEKEVLQAQLEQFTSKISSLNDELDRLSDVDRDLYRALLQADPISDDVRQVGVGGSAPYPEFAKYPERTSELLTESAETLDAIQRRIDLQNASYRELTDITRRHATAMHEMPAVLPTDGPVISGFGSRMHPILKIRRPHNGIDILVGTGTPIVAPGDGVVKEAGVGGGLGNYVRVHHPTVGYVTTFAHLSKIGEGIKPGVQVKRGQVLGLSGNTGLSKSPHLHYEVRKEDGKPLNPVLFFAPSMTPTEFQKLLVESQKDGISLD